MAGLVAAGWGGSYMTRMIIVVDEDIDITNPPEVMWAMATRWDPKTQTDIIDGCWTGYIDPRLPPDKRDSGDTTLSRIIIYAMRPFHWKDQFPDQRGCARLRRPVRRKWGDRLPFLKLIGCPRSRGAEARRHAREWTNRPKEEEHGELRTGPFRSGQGDADAQSAAAAGSCDCQFHIYGDPAISAEPGHDLCADRRDVPGRRHDARGLGFERGVIVHSSVYGSDHRLLLDTLENLEPALRKRYRATSIIDDNVSDKELERLNAAGVCAARLNIAKMFGVTPSHSEAQRTIDRIRGLGWHVRVHVRGNDLLEFSDVLKSVRESRWSSTTRACRPEQGPRSAGLPLDPRYPAARQLVDDGLQRQPRFKMEPAGTTPFRSAAPISRRRPTASSGPPTGRIRCGPSG